MREDATKKCMELLEDSVMDLSFSFYSLINDIGIKAIVVSPKLYHMLDMELRSREYVKSLGNPGSYDPNDQMEIFVGIDSRGIKIVKGED